MALKRINADFEIYKVVEFDKFAIKSYNAVHDTNFKTMDIKDVNAEDLNICDADKYTYLLTYSFPCTDISNAGQRKGMAKNSGTRSGLLWEVERILKELHEKKMEMPQVLFMENVPQVHGKKNIDDFKMWLEVLTGLGYKNYWKDLNAKDYGVAQNRNRTYMFSIKEGGEYVFPEKIPLKKTFEQYLENDTSEEFYIKTERARQLIEKLIKENDIQNKSICDLTVNMPCLKNIYNCITARENRGINNRKAMGNGVIEKHISTEVKQIGNIAKENTFTNPQVGRVYDVNGISPTINTFQGGNRQPKIICAIRGRNPENPSCRTAGIKTEQRLEFNRGNTTNTITTVQKDNVIVEIENYAIRNLTPRECGRLMGVTDEDIDKMIKVNSKTQLYKQFGNSIVVDVMCTMFSNLNIKRKKGNNENRQLIKQT